MTTGRPRRGVAYNLTAPEPDETTVHGRIRRALIGALRHGLNVHVPNGVQASAAAWNRVRALGAVPGFPDLLLLRDERAGTLEIKTPAGRESKAQIAFAADLARAGIPRAVVRDEHQALAAVAEWGWPLWGVNPRESGLPKGWNLLQADYYSAQRDMLGAWRELCHLRPPPRVLRQMRLELDSAMRQIHEINIPEIERTCLRNAIT